MTERIQGLTVKRSTKMKKNIGVLLLLIALTFTGGCNSKPKKDIGVGPIKEINLSTSINRDLANNGEVLYASKCTMCHKFDQKTVGPALGNITIRRSPEWIMNMMLNPEVMVKENEAAKTLFTEYNNIPMINQNLSENEARSILEFLRQNDSR